MELGANDGVKAHQIIHDLRNSLGLMINYANLIGTELADRPEVLEDLKEIESAGLRAADLVGELTKVISAAELRREEP